MKVYVEDKTYKVYFSITHKCKRFYIYTGLQSTEKFDGMVFPRSDKSAKAKTKRLAELYSNVEDYILLHKGEDVPMLKSHLREIIKGGKVAEKNFLDYMQMCADSKNLKAGTKRVYDVTIIRIRNFDAKCTFDTITRDWLDKFVKHEYDRGRMPNGVHIDLRNIKATFNWAIDNEITTLFPFRKYVLPHEETRKRCLSLEQMRQLRDAEFHTNPQRESRDLFMLGFYLIGINISDLLDLKPTDLRGGRICYKRNKTGRLYDIKIEPEALEIIKRYKGKKYLLKYKDNIKFNLKHFESNLNFRLKRLGKFREYSKEPMFPYLSTYYNRHTWATLASEIDIPMEVIGRALGHAMWDNAVTSTYIKYDTKKIDEANRKVIDYLNADLECDKDNK